MKGVVVEAGFFFFSKKTKTKNKVPSYYSYSPQSMGFVQVDMVKGAHDIEVYPQTSQRTRAKVMEARVKETFIYSNAIRIQSQLLEPQKSLIENSHSTTLCHSP